MSLPRGDSVNIDVNTIEQEFIDAIPEGKLDDIKRFVCQINKFLNDKNQTETYFKS